MRPDFSHFQTKHAARDFGWVHVDNTTRYSLPRTMYQAVHRKRREQKNNNKQTKRAHFNAKFDMHCCQIQFTEISKLNTWSHGDNVCSLGSIADR